MNAVFLYLLRHLVSKVALSVQFSYTCLIERKNPFLGLRCSSPRLHSWVSVIVVRLRATPEPTIAPTLALTRVSTIAPSMAPAYADACAHHVAHFWRRKMVIRVDSNESSLERVAMMVWAPIQPTLLESLTRESTSVGSKIQVATVPVISTSIVTKIVTRPSSSCRKNSMRKWRNCTFMHSVRSSWSLLRNNQIVYVDGPFNSGHYCFWAARFVRKCCQHRTSSSPLVTVWPGWLQACTKDVYLLPKELDEKVAKLHLPEVFGNASWWPLSRRRWQLCLTRGIIIMSSAHELFGFVN